MRQETRTGERRNARAWAASPRRRSQFALRREHAESAFERGDGAGHILVGMRGRGKSAGPGGDVYTVQQKAGPDLHRQFQRDPAFQGLPASLAGENLFRRFIAAVKVEIRELAVGAPSPSAAADYGVDAVA